MESLREGEELVKEKKVVVCIACCVIYNSVQELENHQCSTSDSPGHLGQFSTDTPSGPVDNAVNNCAALVDHDYCCTANANDTSARNATNDSVKSEDQLEKSNDESHKKSHQATCNESTDNKLQHIDFKLNDASHEKSHQSTNRFDEKSHDEIHNSLSHQVNNNINGVNYDKLYGDSQKIYSSQQEHQSTDAPVVNYKLDGTIVVSDEESDKESGGEVDDDYNDITDDNIDSDDKMGGDVDVCNSIKMDDKENDIINAEDYNKTDDEFDEDDDTKNGNNDDKDYDDDKSDLLETENNAESGHEENINNVAKYVSVGGAKLGLTDDEQFDETDDESDDEIDDSDDEPGLIIDEEYNETGDSGEGVNDSEDESIIYVSDSESSGTDGESDEDTKEDFNNDLADYGAVYNDIDDETHADIDNRFDDHNDGFEDNDDDDLNDCDNTDDEDSDESNENNSDGNTSSMAMYHCVPCGHVYNNETAYNNHPCKRQKPLKAFSCGMCGKTFQSLVILRVHMKIHIGIKEFICKICSKAFLHKHNLVTHEISHSTARPFICEICDATFKRKTHHDRHQLVHSGQKLYSCDKCDFKSARLYAITRHEINVHTAKRPYTCTQCSYSFSEKYKLASHMKNVHGSNKKAKKSQRTMVPCLFCDKKFYWRKHVAVHMQSDHSEEFQTLAIKTEPEENSGEYRRNSSQQDTDYEPGLSSTVSQLTQDGLDKSKCWFCAKEFSRETGLIRHMKVHHAKDYKECKKEENLDG